MLRRILKAGVMAGVLFSVGMFCIGCGGSLSYEDGMLYFVNNTRPWRVEEQVYAIFDQRETLIPFNMTVDGEVTGEGAVLLSDELLAGGTVVTVVCKFQQQGASTFNTGPLTLTIDGNVTVEAFEVDWGTSGSMIRIRVRKGIYTGGDPAAGGGG